MPASDRGCGLYILDDITALEQWRPEPGAKPAHLFAQRPAALEITSTGGQVRKLSIPAKPGITRYAWDGRFVGASGSSPQG